MPLESYELCPSCRHMIVLTKSMTGGFRCPDCQCEFRHNFRKLVIGIPVVLILTLLLGYLTYGSFSFVVLLGIGVTAFVLLFRIPPYIIIRSGSGRVPAEQPKSSCDEAGYRQLARNHCIRGMVAIGASAVLATFVAMVDSWPKTLQDALSSVSAFCMIALLAIAGLENIGPWLSRQRLKTRPKTLTLVVVGLLTIAVIDAVVIVKVRAARAATARAVCIENLKQLDTAREKWDNENKAINEFLRSRRRFDLFDFRLAGTMPRCPANGVYSIKENGTPICSHGPSMGHKLEGR